MTALLIQDALDEFMSARAEKAESDRQAWQEAYAVAERAQAQAGV